MRKSIFIILGVGAVGLLVMWALNLGENPELEDTVLQLKQVEVNKQDFKSSLCRAVAGVLNYPSDKLAYTDLTTDAFNESEGDILFALELRSPDNTFAKMEMVVAKSGVLLTPELHEWCVSQLQEQDSLIQQFALKDGIHGFSGLGMAGPGGSSERSVATWSERGIDLQIAFSIPRDGLAEDESTKAYHAFVFSDTQALSAKLIEVMGLLADHFE